MKLTPLSIKGDDFNLEVSLTDEQIKDLYKRAGFFGLNWSIEDIHIRVEDMGYEPLTHEEAVTLADELEYNADANYGITWEHLESAIESYFSRKNK